MSYYQEKVCDKILREYFGDIVAKVGAVLFLRGMNPLRVICVHSKLPVSKVSVCVCVCVCVLFPVSRFNSLFTYQSFSFEVILINFVVMFNYILA